MRDLRETLRTRAEWESTGAGCARWIVFFACALVGPILGQTLAPGVAIPLVLAILVFWIWWSLPFIAPRASLLNAPLILAVIVVNIATLVAIVNR